MCTDAETALFLMDLHSTVILFHTAADILQSVPVRIATNPIRILWCIGALNSVEENTVMQHQSDGNLPVCLG